MTLRSRLTDWIDRLLAYFNLCLHCALDKLHWSRLPEKHRRRVHYAILVTIAGDIVWAGMRFADLGFLILALLMEGETKPATSPGADPSPYQIDADYLDSQGHLDPVKPVPLTDNLDSWPDPHATGYLADNPSINTKGSFR